MVALARHVSSLAILVGSAAGARRSKRRMQSAGTKLIAGVPVFNYQAAYAGESMAEAGAEEEWVVMVKPGVTEAQIKDMCAVAKNGCKLTGNPSRGGVPFFEMRGSEADLEAVIASGHGAAKFVEPDQIVRAIPEVEPEDATASLWGLNRVGAYQRANEGEGVNVFVLDTGVRTTHQDFGGRGIPTLDMSSGRPVECNGDTGCAADRQGHGTHCAGSAGGASYGVAPGATIRSVKVLSDQGSGSWSWSYAALDWLATSSLRPAVASMSLGGPGIQSAMKDAVDAATNANVIVVVAGGNSNLDSCEFSPAFVPSAITVGSTTSQDTRSSFSNYGACTNIWAPGSSILSAGHASDTSSATYSGTSMACPHVAGGAALVLQRNPGFNYGKVLEALQTDADADMISGLYPSDTNKMLFVGRPQEPTPAPVPTPVSPTPVPTPAPTPVPTPVPAYPCNSPWDRLCLSLNCDPAHTIYK